MLYCLINMCTEPKALHRTVQYAPLGNMVTPRNDHLLLILSNDDLACSGYLHSVI